MQYGVIAAAGDVAEGRRVEYLKRDVVGVPRTLDTRGVCVC